MRELTHIIGIILIVLGIVTLSYQGFTYHSQEKIAEIGSLKITAETQKKVTFPPVLGGASLVAGIILVVVAKITKK